MPLTVLNVAYPLAPVGPDAVGGAEQVVHLLDQHLVARGHRSIVIACEGSQAKGELVPTPRASGPLDDAARTAALAEHAAAVRAVLGSRRVDVVHLHGHDFDGYLPPSGVPVLATIHLPPELLSARLETISRPMTWASGVSAAHHARLPRVPMLLPPIENGVAVDDWPRALRRRRFVLVLGRVCPEKGFHLAIDAATAAGAPLFIGGRVFAYAAHQRYFEERIQPRLGTTIRFLGPVGVVRKRRLLNSARCLLVPSLVAETSSLVAMEAMACGTPVIAFPAGALAGIIDDGVTGFVVRDACEMACAIRRAGRIDPEACRRAARARFDVSRMADEYLHRYEQLVRWSRQPGSAPS